MHKQAKKKIDRKKVGCACCAIGCSTPVLFVLVFLYMFYRVASREEFGENRETAPMFYAEKGGNFCYYWTYLNRYFEFTITEQDFLDWCSDGNWKPIEIKSLLLLPEVRNNDDDWPVVNERRGSPLSITRYTCGKAEHTECSSRYGECRIDSTGKTDEACFRLVDEGYYYEHRHSNGGGVYILYDREKKRCYINYSHH